MKIYKLDEMKKGWFVGGFEPTVLKTRDVEVAYKEYKKGEKETKHYHKIATEITVVVKGKVKMFNRIFEKNDIILCEPGDQTSFEALEDSANVVVKIPGALNDKYIVEDK